MWLSEKCIFKKHFPLNSNLEISTLVLSVKSGNVNVLLKCVFPLQKGFCRSQSSFWGLPEFPLHLPGQKKINSLEDGSDI